MVTEEQKRLVFCLHARGATYAEIMQRTGFTRSKVSYVKKLAGTPPRKSRMPTKHRSEIENENEEITKKRILFMRQKIERMNIGDLIRVSYPNMKKRKAISDAVVVGKYGLKILIEKPSGCRMMITINEMIDRSVKIDSI